MVNLHRSGPAERGQRGRAAQHRPPRQPALRRSRRRSRHGRGKLPLRRHRPVHRKLRFAHRCAQHRRQHLELGRHPAAARQLPRRRRRQRHQEPERPQLHRHRGLRHPEPDALPRQHLLRRTVPLRRHRHRHSPPTSPTPPTPIKSITSETASKTKCRSAPASRSPPTFPAAASFPSPEPMSLTALQSLSTALQSGNSSTIATAGTAVSNALGALDTAQVFYGNTVNELTYQRDLPLPGKTQHHLLPKHPGRLRHRNRRHRCNPGPNRPQCHRRRCRPDQPASQPPQLHPLVASHYEMRSRGPAALLFFLVRLK